MKEKIKKRNKKLQRFFLFLIIVVAFIITTLVIQINKLQKSNSDNKSVSNITNEKQDNTKKIDSNAEIEILKYEAFINQKHTQNQLENLSDNDVIQIYNNYEKLEKIEYDNALGSASTNDGAANIASSLYRKQNNTVKSSNVIGQNELYYVVNVIYDYVSENVSKRYSKNVIVFKSFYYNDEKNVFNVDDIENAKIILDLDNYINNLSNAGKVNIQSFIQKNNQVYEYSLYYLKATYGQSDRSDTVDLMKKVVSIHAATGEIIDTKNSIIKENIEV